MTIHNMQDLCRDTVAYISKQITADMPLIEICKLCESYMKKNGADSFWYWDVGAFVFSGSKTAVSVSGKDYITEQTIIALNDIITIDLSPQHKNIWGDYARTLVVENGTVVLDIDDIKNDEWRNGIITENALHEIMMRYATPETTFEELFCYMNSEICKCGYKNCDFLGNLGHSIETEKNSRIYIEKGNKTKLSEVEAFTFEPHISLPNSKYGYKKENVYQFNDGLLVEL